MLSPCAQDGLISSSSLYSFRRQHDLDFIREVPYGDPKRGACAGELLSGSEQGTVSIFDVNHLAEPVATLKVRLLSPPYTLSLMLQLTSVSSLARSSMPGEDFPEIASGLSSVSRKFFAENCGLHFSLVSLRCKVSFLHAQLNSPGPKLTRAPLLNGDVKICFQGRRSTQSPDVISRLLWHLACPGIRPAHMHLKVLVLSA